MTHMLIMLVTVIAVLLLFIQPQRAHALAARLPIASVVLAIGGYGIQSIGLSTTSDIGSVLIRLGMVALLCAAWPLRRWPGGMLILLGIAANSCAMMVYGRMPITPDVLGSLGQVEVVGTVLAGSKDIVAQGIIAEWLGDRFTIRLPLFGLQTVWSIGDIVMLAGILRMTCYKLPNMNTALPITGTAPVVGRVLGQLA